MTEDLRSYLEDTKDMYMGDDYQGRNLVKLAHPELYKGLPIVYWSDEPVADLDLNTVKIISSAESVRNMVNNGWTTQSIAEKFTK